MTSRAVELKYVRRILSSFAEDFISISGMDFYHDRNFYKYADDAIYFAQLEVSGGFGRTHWKSLQCSMCIYYKDFPGFSKPPFHESGNPIPTYRQSRLTFGLERTFEQSEIIETLLNPILHYDRYFWHVLDDESNLGEVLSNIATVVRDSGLPLVHRDPYSRAVMLPLEIAARSARKLK